MAESLLLLGYYSLMLCGLTRLHGTALAFLLPASQKLPSALGRLLALGISAASIAWLGFMGFFRIPFAAELTGFVCAVIGARTAFSAYQHWHLRIKTRGSAALSHNQRVFVGLLLAILALMLVTKHCYLFGGRNNEDDMRSLILTSQFAANYLKPALHFNPSLPISYSYYLYELSAFLYASTGGIGWPALPVLILNITAIVFFFSTLRVLFAYLLPRTARSAYIAALLGGCFYGLDIFIHPYLLHDMHIDWWNPYQVSQMASYFHWTYQYLFAATFGLASLVALERWRRSHNSEFALIAGMFALLCVLYGAITGVWFTIAFILALSLCLVKTPSLFSTLPIRFSALFAILFLVLPQSFTFIGRDILFSFTATPVLWFTRTPFSQSTSSHIIGNLLRTLIEFGPLLTLAFCALPFYAARWIKKKNAVALGLVTLACVSVLGISFTHAHMADWIWRGGNLLLTLVIISTYGAFYSDIPASRKRFAHILIAFGLIPGAINFFGENILRFYRCQSLVPDAYIIHREVPLHDALLVATPEERGLFESPEAGRLSIGITNYNRQHGNNADFNRNALNGDYKRYYCVRTRYGQSPPSGFYITREKDGSFIRRECAWEKE